MRQRLIYIVFVPLCTLISFFQFQCTEKSTSASDSLTYLNHHDSVKYVGMQACRQCHASIYNSFIETGMGQSFHVASKTKSAADFSTRHVVYDTLNDLYYTAFFRGEDMLMMEFRLAGKDTIHKRIEKVAYIIGSGQHTNSHLMQINGYLYQMPMTWYAQQKKWDLPPGFEGGRNSRFTRIIGEECMSCHNALPVFEKGSENKFTKIPGGIDCERCHGPGELHVKEKMAGHIVDTSGSHFDPTIVNPRNLSWELQIDLCQRCHLQGNSVLKPGKTFRDFRPGMRLSDFWEVYMPRYSGADKEFIMASHADRLQQSKCFVQSNKGKSGEALQFTCISCHNPHVSVKVTGKEVFNNTCTGCHDMKKLGTCTNKEVVKMFALSSDLKHVQKHTDCVSCHMPRSGTIDIPHVTVHDHYIRKPATEEKIAEVKKFIGIACVNNPNADAYSKAKANISYYERFEGTISSLDTALSWINSGAMDNRKLELAIHVYYLKNRPDEVIKLVANKQAASVTDAWTAYRAGQSYFNKNEFQSSLSWLKQAVNLAPANLAFQNKLAEVFIQLQQPDEAISILQELLKVQPKYLPALNNLGFALMLKQNITEANQYYETALLLDPDYEPVLLNKAGLYNLLGEKQKARAILKKLLLKKPGDPHILGILAKI